jgi:hypothetical protein
MTPRLRVRPPRKEFTPEEKLEREKERIRKLQATRLEIEGTRDGRTSVDQTPGSMVKGCDRLLEALIKEHPEKDPANTK